MNYKEKLEAKMDNVTSDLDAIRKLTDLINQSAKLAQALEHFNPYNMDHDTYLDVFDCIRKVNESVVEFNQYKFGNPAKEALDAFNAWLEAK